MSIKKICCVGANRVGGTFSSVLAFSCSELDVKVVDESPDKINGWNNEELPIFENNLADIVNQCRDKNLFFTTETNKAIRDADIIFICTDTNLKSQESEFGKGVDLKPIESAGRLIAKVITSPKIIVEKSTIPILAAKTLSSVLKANIKSNINFVVISNPEFLSRGSAVNDIFYPERVLIGGDKTPESSAAIEALVFLYEHWVPRSKIIITDMWSVQLTKLATHVLMAQTTSSINSLAEFCEKTNADISEVALALGMDNSIDLEGIQPSLGFGDPTFYKNIQSLVYLCESLNLPQVAKYWQKVLDINEYQKKRFTKRILEAFFNTLEDKKIAIWGFAFKKDTDITMYSPAISVCKMLLEVGASLNIYDPVVPKNQILEDLKIACAGNEKNNLNLVTIFEDPYETVKGTGGIVVCTDWPLFSVFDFFKIYCGMLKPAYIFDGVRVLPHKELQRIGFKIFTIGKNINSN